MPGPLEDFFNRYTPFQYRPKEPAAQQWKRLRRERKFNTKEYKEALAGYKTALVKQFNKSYGKSESSLDTWHGLLRRVGTAESDLPKTVKQCKEMISKTHVNLVDLVDAGEGGTVQKFDTEEELSSYTKEEEKIFPRENANAGNLLKFLLRHIASPRTRKGTGKGTVERKRGGRRRT